MKTIAAIAVGPGREFEIAEVELDAPRADEILVKITSAGICHTDIAVKEQHLPLALPAVLGHEGAGVVVAVGEKIKRIRPGDRVALTFRSCGECAHCTAGLPAYCSQFHSLNGSGKRTDGSQTLRHNGTPIGGSFFGQSSFSGYALSYERNTIKIPDGFPLELSGPFGCGIQTGAGAVMKALDCSRGSSLLVMGGGTVGLSAVMAAVTRACSTVIVSEPDAGRRELALELGATHCIDPTKDDLATAVRRIIQEGVNYAFDTSGRPDAIDAAISCLGTRGTLGLVGIPSNPAAAVSTNLYGLISRGITIRGIVEGDVDPETFIPELMNLHLSGKFPVDKIVKTYPLADINRAIEDQHTGCCTKAILIP